jgi:hypothetical protein
MDKKTLLTKLNELFNIPEVQNGFPSKEALIDWANKVNPLLRFNQQYYITFYQNAHKMNLPLSSYTLGPALRIMVSQLQMAIEELKMDIEHDSKEDTEPPPQVYYVDKSRIQELKAISTTKFDLSKLIRILEEMNICNQKQCYISLITLTRALLDHVPPIFSCKNFSEVSNNYAGIKSFKDSMIHLENSSRKIADQHLHSQIRQTESLPNKTQVNFSNDIDVLLSEIVRVLK